MDFTKLIQLLEDQKRGLELPKGYVPSTFLFAFLGDKLVGRVMIRHELNDFLRRLGGHIGYGVVPSERRRGFASQMLIKALAYAKQLGLNRALVTCDEANAASQKVIERSAGVFAGFTEQGPKLPRKRLYWIALD